jgi:CheY-like chemotaxis protein
MATILLVEDNDDVRDMMALALELAGHVVWPAANGRDALARLQERDELPCLILMDLMMPVMNGWELRAALKDTPRLSSIPVVVVSALNADLARRLPATDYLPKPVDIDRLLDLVCEYCHGAGPR